MVMASLSWKCRSVYTAVCERHNTQRGMFFAASTLRLFDKLDIDLIRHRYRRLQVAPPRLALSSGDVEALKWLALALMTLDHINTFLYGGAFPAIFKMGRIAMPIFGFVLAYNLARPGALEHGAYGRVMRRLAVFGLLASPAFVALVGWWPLNIMFTLLLAAALMRLLESGGWWRILSSIVLLGACGALVEFRWFGVLFCLAAWWYCKQPGWSRLLIWGAAAASLYLINKNLWAMAALPVIFAAPLCCLSMPRLRYVFYAYYPAHLTMLWYLARTMRDPFI